MGTDIQRGQIDRQKEKQTECQSDIQTVGTELEIQTVSQLGKRVRDSQSVGTVSAGQKDSQSGQTDTVSRDRQRHSSSAGTDSRDRQRHSQSAGTDSRDRGLQTQSVSASVVQSEHTRLIKVCSRQTVSQVSAQS